MSTAAGLLGDALYASIPAGNRTQALEQGCASLLPWPHCCVQLQHLYTGFWERFVPSFGPRVSAGAGIHPDQDWSCATLQDVCFEAPHSKFLQADGHLTLGNLGSVASKSLINSFLLVGPGMLLVPSNLLLPPGTFVFWIFIS